MIRKLQFLKTAVLSVFLLGGANLAWADDVTLDLDVSFRVKKSNDVWVKFDNNYPKTASNENNVFECVGKNGLFVLQKYTVSNLSRVKKLTLSVTNYSSADALAVWAVDKNNLGTNWTTSTSISTIVSAYTATVGIEPLETEGTINNTYLKDTRSSTGDVYAYVIEGNALARLKGRANGNTFTLLITNRTADLKSSTTGRKFYSSGDTDSNKHPQLTAEYMSEDLCPVEIGETKYESLNSAVACVTDGGNISILKSFEITDRVDFTKNMTIVPSKADLSISISTSLAGDYNAFGLGTASKTIQIGSDAYALTIDGQRSSIGDRKLVEVTNGRINLTNVHINDVYTTATQGVICGKGSGYVMLKDVTFNGCRATATNAGIVFCGANDHIILSGNNQFIGCTDYGMYLERRFQVDEMNGVSNTTPITVFVKTANIASTNGVVATKVLPAEVSKFVIMNAGYGLYRPASGRGDMKACEGYPMTIGDAGAATLMLPFASTIPNGVTCYKLTYTSGTSVNAAEVTGGTLDANTPVLINATKGYYNFKNAANKVDGATAFNTDDTFTAETALTGVYKTTTVTSGSYILYYKSEDPTNYPLGFYKADGTTNTVAANRAYLTASAQEARLAINFDGDDTTGIEAVSTQHSEEIKDNVYYDLSGRRVAQPTKGLYIVNGKKVFIK